jgi:hypothetical protein
MEEHCSAAGLKLLVAGHLLAPFRWAAQPLATIVRGDPKLLRDLFELDRLRMHVIGLALTYLNVDDLSAVAPTLFHARIREAIQQILGRCPSGIHRVLRRLPSVVLSREAYRSLIELLDDPPSAKLLYHLDERELTDPTLRVLRDIPKVLRPILTDVVQYVSLLDGLPAGLRWLAERTGAPSFDALLAELAAQKQPAQLIARVKKLVSQLPLPDRLPPMKIGKAMRIDTTKAICALAKEFRNCLATYTDQVDAGTSAIYLWDEPGWRAVCHVARHGRLGWALDDALGPGNVKPNSNDRQRITDAFGQVGIPEARLFEAIELIAQASVSKAERRLRRREREDLHEIAFM